MRRFFYPFFFLVIFFVWGFSIWQLVSYKNSFPVRQVASASKSEITQTPIPLLKKINTPTPMPSEKDIIMQAINVYRKGKGLSTVVFNDSTCSFAAIRAQEITKDFSHSGFQTRLSSHTLPYPNYALVTENIAETNDYSKVVELWANSPSHAKNMQADTPYVCVESSGDFYAYEGWRPL